MRKVNSDIETFEVLLPKDWNRDYKGIVERCADHPAIASLESISYMFENAAKPSLFTVHPSIYTDIFHFPVFCDVF